MKIEHGAPFAPLQGDGAKKPAPRRQAAKWVPQKSIPDSADTPPEQHYKHGKPSLVHEYQDTNGSLLGYVCRFNVGENEKLFCPLTWCKNKTTGEEGWRWKAWDTPRPLYGLNNLADRPDAQVVVCEGEKSADAVCNLLPEHVSVTSPNGSQSASKVDWEPLVGRNVIIWPDNDKAGLRYAKDVAKSLRVLKDDETSVAIVNLPADKPDGWDAADALAEGWSQEKTLTLIQSATEVDTSSSKCVTQTDAHPEPNDQAVSAGRRGTRLRNSLLELVDGCELWHDQERMAFATVPINGHKENIRLDSREFGIWFSGEAHKHLKEPIGEQAMRDTLRVLEARSIHDGRLYKTFLRIGGCHDEIFLDLGQGDWTVIKLDRHGWAIVDQCPLKAIRTQHMLPLPTPEGGELLEDLLRPLVNVNSERDFRLIVAWLVSAFRNVGEYPILAINGEQGSAKSTLARMVRQLVDPNKAANRATPRDERDLVVAARNSHVISLDNLSGLPAWLSDALCRISTGAGFSARALHTDMDEVVVDLENPIITNGIPEIAGRPDLTDRSLLISLPSIKDEQRRSKTELWAEFEETRPLILGALLDAVSAAIRNLPNINLERKPRMANAAEWVSAAEPGLGWEQGTHLNDLEANRKNAIETSLENEPVAIGIMELAKPWTGTPTALHEKLSGTVPGIPKTVQSLGGALRRIGPILSEAGITIERRRGKERLIAIKTECNVRKQE